MYSYSIGSRCIRRAMETEERNRSMRNRKYQTENENENK